MTDLFADTGKMVSLDRQIACVTRELAMCRRVYPAWIKAKRMTQAAADTEIAAMEAVLATLQRVQVAEANYAERLASLKTEVPDGQ